MYKRINVQLDDTGDQPSPVSLREHFKQDEKPYSSERFRNVGSDYLTAFLDPAVNAGILIRTGEQTKATYRVTY